MSASVMKIETEAEACSVCGGSGSDLLTPEEYDADASPMQVPLRSMLLHLNNNKVVPDGRLCAVCARRAVESYEFSTALSSRSVPPLSEKIRALRRRLHELTQKIDVFIVVGGPGVNAGSTYSEDDIIMVEREALAAAAASDDQDLERARNARGDNVYQCTVCPQSFQHVWEYRAHMSCHPAHARHSCWTCGAQYEDLESLREHSQSHQPAPNAHCNVCDCTFQSLLDLRRHEPSCTRCPLPACPHPPLPSRAALSAHVRAAHEAEHVCGACYLRCSTQEQLSAHRLAHHQDSQFVCGYDGCILRFQSRNNLMSHIRKSHGGALAALQDAAGNSCRACQRTFASAAALKRHARAHREHEAERDVLSMLPEGAEGEGEAEYLEVETLEELELALTDHQ